MWQIQDKRAELLEQQQEGERAGSKRQGLVLPRARFPVPVSLLLPNLTRSTPQILNHNPQTLNSPTYPGLWGVLAPLFDFL